MGRRVARGKGRVVSAYAFYVGMSYGACAIAIVAEALMLRARRRRAREGAKG